MKPSRALHLQHGATLVVGLIMLAVITLMVTSAFTLSSTNLRSVGNMQLRDEAIAAANKSIGQVIESAFTSSPANLAAAQQTIYVDLNNDGINDYEVSIATPNCISKTALTGTSTSGTSSSLSLGTAFYNSTVTYYSTVWDITATAKDLTASGGTSGTLVQVRQGVRKILDQTTASLVCG